MLTWGKENQSFNTQYIHLPVYICVTIKLLVYTNHSYTNLHKCYSYQFNINYDVTAQWFVDKQYDICYHMTFIIDSNYILLNINYLL